MECHKAPILDHSCSKLSVLSECAHSLPLALECIERLWYSLYDTRLICGSGLFFRWLHGAVLQVVVCTPEQVLPVVFKSVKITCIFVKPLHNGKISMFIQYFHF